MHSDINEVMMKVIRNGSAYHVEMLVVGACLLFTSCNTPLPSKTQVNRLPPVPIENEKPSHNRERLKAPVQTAKTKASSASLACTEEDLAPLKFSKLGEIDGNKYFFSGTLRFSKAGLHPETKKPVIKVSEDSTLNFISPLLSQVASRMQDNLIGAGKQWEGCQNSFNGASAWVAGNVPPRIQGKASATKRTCTCAFGGCWKNDVASGEASVGWRIDANITSDKKTIELTPIREFLNSSDNGGVVYQLLKDLHLIDVLDNLFRMGIKDIADNVGIALSSIGDTPSYLQAPGIFPLNYQIDSIAWTGPRVSSVMNAEMGALIAENLPPAPPAGIQVMVDPPPVQPFALTIKRSWEVYQGSGCNAIRCIREYGIDSVIKQTCPHL